MTRECYLCWTPHQGIHPCCSDCRNRWAAQARRVNGTRAKHTKAPSNDQRAAASPAVRRGESLRGFGV